MSGTTVKLFLCGDVMPGRGIDQILPHPVAPRLHESYVRDARVYVKLAEQQHGPIPRAVDFEYVWGDGLGILEAQRPDARIVNLETSITTSDEHWPGKGVHYRMHPAHAPLLTTAGIDCCVLANNHVLDWGYGGLVETLATLEAAGVAATGAGHTLEEATRPVRLPLSGRSRAVVLGLASSNSGVPAQWAASAHHAGVNLVDDFSAASAAQVAGALTAERRDGDVFVASIHWGGNWGYDVPARHRRFAHALVDHGVDVVHGHSSHHALGIEVYRGKLVLYGCGDLVNDYEGIEGHEHYRGDLGLMYFPTLNAGDGSLARLEMVPTTMRGLSLGRADEDGTRWLAEMLTREGEGFGTRAEITASGAIALRWED